MVTKVIIDPRLIAAWTSSTNYRIEIEAGLVREVGNNKSYSPALTVMTDTTYASGPLVASVEPAYQSFADTAQAVINFDHAIFGRDAINFYLYRTDTQDLIETIPTSGDRVTIGVKEVSIDLSDLMLGGVSYFLTSDPSPFEDIYNFKSQQITSSTFKYTPTPAQIVNQIPNPGNEQNFATDVSIALNKNLTANSGTWVLHRLETGDTRTFTLTDTIGTSTNKRVTLTSGPNSTITINDINDEIMPEGRYYLTSDDWNYTDSQRIGLLGFADTSSFSFYQCSISNMEDKEYNHTVSQILFGGSQVLDVDLDPDKIYTLTVSNDLGTLVSASTGTTIGNLYISTGTKAIINQGLSTLDFTPNEPGANDDGTYSYSLTKDEVVLVSKTLNLIGIPYVISNVMELTIEGAGVIDEPLTLTAIINTSSTMSGLVTFKENGIALSTTTISSQGVATASVSFNTTGTKFISAEWPGGRLTDRIKYGPLDTGDTLKNIKLASTYNGDLEILTVRNGFWADINLAARFDNGIPLGSNDGTVTFKYVQTTNTTTSYTSSTSLTILEVGAKGFDFSSNWDGSPWGNDLYWVKLNSVSTLAIGDWITVTGTRYGTTPIKSSYRVSAIHPNNFVSIDARSEDDNPYYPHNPIKDKVTNSNQVILDPIIFQATFTKSDVFRTSEGIIGTATIVNNVATLPTTSLSTGSYTIVADWSGRATMPKYFGLSSNYAPLEAADRADYPPQEPGTQLSSLRLTGPSYVHQLRNVTYDLTNLYSTSTTGTITLSGYSNTANSVLDTDLFNTSTITFQVNTNDFVTGVNKIQSYWEGQAYVPGQYYPFYGTSSNAISITYQLGSLALGINTTTNTIYLPTTITAIANTSTADAGTVSFYDGETLLQTVNADNNSATITLSSGTLAIGSHNIIAKWNNTVPQVQSEVLVSNIVGRGEISTSTTTTDAVRVISLSTSTLPLFNQDGTFYQQPVIATVGVYGEYFGNKPTGTYSLRDEANSLTTTDLTLQGEWIPSNQGQTVGTHYIYADYSGDNWFNPKTGTTSSVALTLTKIVPDMNVTVSNTSTSSLVVTLNKLNGGTFTNVANIFRRQYENTGTFNLQWNGSTFTNVAYNLSLSQGTYPPPSLHSSNSPFSVGGNGSLYNPDWQWYWQQVEGDPIYSQWRANNRVVNEGVKYFNIQLTNNIDIKSEYESQQDARPFTFSCWINPTSIVSSNPRDSSFPWWHPIFTINGAEGGSDRNYQKLSIGLNEEGKPTIRAYYKYIYNIPGESTYKGFASTASTAVSTGTWTHIAVTRADNSSVIKLYVNGNLSTSLDCSYAFLPSPYKERVNGLALGNEINIGSLVEATPRLQYLFNLYQLYGSIPYYSDPRQGIFPGYNLTFYGYIANPVFWNEEYWTGNFTPPTAELLRDDWTVNNFYATATNVAGVVEYSTSSYIANTCTFYAEYLGDDVYLASTSTSTTITLI